MVEYKVGFAEIAKRVKAAAGIMIIYRVYTLIYFSLFIPALTTCRGPQNGQWQGTGPTCGKSSLTCLRVVLTSYYEDIVKMDGASGLNQKVAYKRQIKRLALLLPPAGEGAAAEDNGGAAEAEVANTSEPAPPPAEPAAAPAKAAPARAGRRSGAS